MAKPCRWIVAFVLREGRDITLISWGAMVKETMAAADALSAEGIAAEVIDLATLKPYDENTVLGSVAKTGRCVIVHEAARTGGFGAEIAALIAERGLSSLLAPVTRVTGYDTVIPLARLEQHYMPSVGRIVARRAQGMPVQLNSNGHGRMRQFMLPDLGEGLEEAEIVAWHVNEGDHVVADQPLVSVETDKAVVEIPSPSERTHCAAVRRQGRHRQGRRAAGRVCRRRAGRTPAQLSASSSDGGQPPRGRNCFCDDVDPKGGSGVACGARARAQARRRSRSRRGDGTRRHHHPRPMSSEPRKAWPKPDPPSRCAACGARWRSAWRRPTPKSFPPASLMRPISTIGATGEDVTIRLVRAIAAACKAEPALNAWYNSGAGERRLIERIDLGIAVDTEGGLIVPVLRNVAERDVSDLRAGLDRMRADAVARSIPAGGAARRDDYAVELRDDRRPLRQPDRRPTAGGDHRRWQDYPSGWSRIGASRR